MKSKGSGGRLSRLIIDMYQKRSFLARSALLPSGAVISGVPRTKTHLENKIPLPTPFDEFWYKNSPSRLACVLGMSFREDNHSLKQLSE